MKKVKSLILLVLIVFGTLYTKAQCASVIVENAIDCNVAITIEAYDCNGNLIESKNATLTPGHWATPSINTVLVTNNIWCACDPNAPCPNKYKIKYGGVDVTGGEICCPQCPPLSCSKACCAVFNVKCVLGKAYFTSSKPGRCP